jgi:hypothetical protein
MVQGLKAGSSKILHAVQSGSEAPPCSCTISTVSFLRGNQFEHGADHPSPSNARLPVPAQICHEVTSTFTASHAAKLSWKPQNSPQLIYCLGWLGKTHDRYWGFTICYNAAHYKHFSIIPSTLYLLVTHRLQGVSPCVAVYYKHRIPLCFSSLMCKCIW